MKYNDNGEYKDIYVKAFDTLPVGAEVDLPDGSTVPSGWTEVADPNEYSTTEKRVGTWIDGKPLYRRVLESGYITSGEYTLWENMSNINVVMIYGWFINTSTGYTQPIGEFRDTNASYVSRVFFDGSNVKAQQNSSYQTGTWKARVVVEYIKTTD